MTQLSELASTFYRIPFQKHTRLELLEDGRVRAPDIAELKNHFGTMHGGMLYALGEAAAAVAMAALLGPERASLFAITRRGAIDYVKPARGAITASCELAPTLPEIVRALEDRSSIEVPVDVRLSDLDGVIVATLRLGWYVARRRGSGGQNGAAPENARTRGSGRA